jgi:glycosyltransferase involved in cell wall biosynthesis
MARIALISSTLPPEGKGGAEAYVAALAESLRDRHELLVLSGASGTGVPGVPHIRLPHLEPVGIDDGAARKALWHLRDQWMPSVHAATVAHLRRFAPDVVHTHEPQGLSAAVFTATARTGRPHVHTAHDLNLLCVRTSMTRDGRPCGGACKDCRIQRLIRGGAFRRHIHAFVAVSDFIRRRHVDAGVVPAERALTIRLAAAPGDARLRRIEGDGLHLGFIGTLAPHKGVGTLLEAFRSAPATWSLTIAGTGPLDAAVRAAAAADPRITHLGHVAGAAKEAFFASLHLLVIPSEWEEPGATVHFEAAVRGVPSVVSDRGGLPELPEATVFRAGEAAALREAVDRLAESPDRLEATSRRLLEGREEFLWSTHVHRVEGVLLAAAGRAGTPASSRISRA